MTAEVAVQLPNLYQVLGRFESTEIQIVEISTQTATFHKVPGRFYSTLHFLYRIHLYGRHQ